jgi:CRP-like cAMP-binding protein
MVKFNRFSDSTEYATFKQGDVIIKEGDSGDLAYGIKEGNVDIMLGGTVIEHVDAGGIFGELSLIDQRTSGVSVVAVTDCQIVPINKRQFMFLIEQTPYFALDVMSVMADRLRQCYGAQGLSLRA